MSADCIRAICFNITTVNSTAETGYAGKIRLMLVLRQVNTGHSTFHWDANIKRFGVGKRGTKMSQGNKRYIVIEQDAKPESNVGFFTRIKVYLVLTIISAVIGAFSAPI